MLDHFRKTSFHFENNNVVCGYCRREIDLELIRNVDIHYIGTKCNGCGKKISVKVDHAGTKHHKITKKTIETLISRHLQ